MELSEGLDQAGQFRHKTKQSKTKKTHLATSFFLLNCLNAPEALGLYDNVYSTRFAIVF